MPSPFPGMDPFLEGDPWPEFHARFLTALRDALAPPLRPRYAATVEQRVYLERLVPPAPATTPQRAVRGERGGPSARDGKDPGPSPVLIPLPIPQEVRESYIEVRARDTGERVAVIELLSPAVKQPGSDGRREYLAQREAVLRSDAHLIELDLLRAGERLPTSAPLPEADYYLLLSHAAHRPMAEVWSVRLRRRLPEIPVPLRGKDRDVELDLQAVLDEVYDRGGYRETLDYDREPAPLLPERDRAWARGRLGARPVVR